MAKTQILHKGRSSPTVVTTMPNVTEIACLVLMGVGLRYAGLLTEAGVLADCVSIPLPALTPR